VGAPALIAPWINPLLRQAACMGRVRTRKEKGAQTGEVRGQVVGRVMLTPFADEMGPKGALWGYGRGVSSSEAGGANGGTGCSPGLPHAPILVVMRSVP
jgi:hypothetical protein